MDCGNDNVSMNVRFGDLVKETVSEKKKVLKMKNIFV
jgi:hypothetical protein